MKTTDLRHSNTIYIIRAIADGSYFVKELASKTEMSEIAVKKILYNLCSKDIIVKCKNLEGTPGRPLVSYNFNPLLHSTLVENDTSEFKVKLINIFGQVLSELSFPLSYQGLSPTSSLKMLYSMLKSNSLFKYNLATYITGENLDEINDISYIIKASKEQLILDSLYDDTLVIYCEIGNKKFLHNYGKIKQISISDTELKEIIDLDFVIKLDGENIDEYLNEALRLINLIKIEEKI